MTEKLRQKIFYILCGILCVSFILSFAITNIAVYLILAFYFIDNRISLKAKFKVVKETKVIWLYMAFFFVQLISLLYSENSDEGIRRVTVMLPTLFLPAVIVSEIKNESYFAKLLTFLKYIIPVIFLVLISVHVFYDNRTLSTFVHFSLNEKLGVSQFYLIFILLIPLVHSYQCLMNRKNTALNVIILLSTIGIILIMGNKMAVIMLFLLTLYVLYLSRKNVKKILIITMTTVSICCLAYQLPIVKQRLNTLLKTTDLNLETIITKNSFTITKNTFEHRILIDYLALKEIKKSFPFGVGIGDRQEALDYQYKRVNYKAGLKNNLNNHNQYLSEFLKSGVLGGLLFIMLIFKLNKMAIKSSSLALATTFLFAIACLVESYLFRQHGIIIFAFLIPLLISHQFHENKFL